LKNYLILMLLCILNTQSTNGQSFSTAYDTVYTNSFSCPHTSLTNSVNNLSFSATTINWHIAASDFPADWLPDFGITVLSTAYSNSGLALWNGTSGATHSASFPAASGGVFSMSLSLVWTSTTGTHWIKIQLTDPATSDTKYIWFVIARDPAFIAGTISGPSALCAGSSVLLTDPVSGGTWGSNNAIATVSAGSVTGLAAGTDTITYSLYNGCGDLGLVSKTITINPMPAPIISGGGGSLGTTISYTHYQWLSGATPILGATNATYAPTANGTYAVTVTDNNGCTATSSSVYDANVYVQDLNDPPKGLHIYPDPANDIVYADNTGSKASYVLVNSAGSIVRQGSLSAGPNRIQIGSLPCGIYLLEVADDKKQKTTTRIVKQ